MKSSPTSMRVLQLIRDFLRWALGTVRGANRRCAHAAPAGDPLSASDAPAPPAGSSFAAPQAATHAREMRRRGRLVIKIDRVPALGSPPSVPAPPEPALQAEPPAPPAARGTDGADP